MRWLSWQDFVAAAIVIGYLVGAFGLWRARHIFGPLSIFGWLAFPIIAMWVTFYLGVIHADEDFYRWAFVALSRTAHFFTIALLFLVVALARKGSDE